MISICFRLLRMPDIAEIYLISDTNASPLVLEYSAII